MNKKILFLIVSVIFALPTVALGEQTLQGVVTSIQNVTITIATPIVIIGWIIAGILYLTSAGSPEKTGTAKKAMIAALIGTILVVLAIGSGTIVSIIQTALGLGAVGP